jgi:peroxiredoxin
MPGRPNLYRLIFIVAAFFTVHVFAQPQPAYKTAVSVQDILKTQMSLMYYERDYLKFSEDLNAYDITGKKISKGLFLKQLCTGLYLPLRLAGSTNGLTGYRLFKLNSVTDAKFKDILESIGNEYYNCYKYEGQRFPDLSFEDLAGHNHNNKTSTGKITVLNFWFIHCQACNEEMPRLNQIKAAYNGHNDIQFFAIAFDKIADLKNFQLKKKFDYTICRTPESNIEQIVGINEYPTHFIIDKNGIILKVTHDPEELNVALSKLVKSI